MNRINKNITLIGEWERFADHCTPKDATEAQKSQMKMAFFAGMSVILMPIMDYITNLSDDDAVAELERFSKEARSYALMTVVTARMRQKS